MRMVFRLDPGCKWVFPTSPEKQLALLGIDVPSARASQ
ncbi:hypothetical protein A176_003471 [Myxococcus hansupus]|uniref:Uncharacterized protein n=1 Tax=Pseudomyxococcus hansupus TaxID=1297742 RepID=A0A0H4WUT9_9BACT|nr:hypothetical protein A176_003471 [Myxococcus hansupus]